MIDIAKILEFVRENRGTALALAIILALTTIVLLTGVSIHIGDVNVGIHAPAENSELKMNVSVPLPYEVNHEPPISVSINDPKRVNQSHDEKSS